MLPQRGMRARCSRLSQGQLQESKQAGRMDRRHKRKNTKLQAPRFALRSSRFARSRASGAGASLLSSNSLSITRFVGSAIAVMMSEVTILSVTMFSFGNAAHSYPGGTAGPGPPRGFGRSGNCAARSARGQGRVGLGFGARRGGLVYC